ncbi:MAG TPA: hypothetical protein VE195_03655 [Acidobacteriaceae bacterium]|nr:hypothetical protein [Acidobacteriaceae bacterium]
MQGTRWKAWGKATAQVPRASVQGMSDQPASTRATNRDRVAAQYKTRWGVRGLAAATLPLLLQFFMLTPAAFATGLQSNAAPLSSQAGTLSPAIGDSLGPALEQVGHTVSQIQIDHWKVSKSWKEQLQSDADSITGDLSHQLPGLLQQAQAAPTALDAQLRVMQNVDALYDVLVRLTLAADLTEKKSDAALLDRALEQLESARKVATAQLLTAAAQQHQQFTELQARAEAGGANQSASTMHGKTIVVDNETRHKAAHHTTHHRKPSPSTPSKSQSNAPPPSGDKSGPQ